jgi:hypothetical protein
MRNSADTASVITHRPIVWDIGVVNSEVPRVRQLEEVYAFVSDTDDMFFDGIHGIDPRLMSSPGQGDLYC